jgi:molybdate transport system substrate-binding protein
MGNLKGGVMRILIWILCVMAVVVPGAGARGEVVISAAVSLRAAFEKAQPLLEKETGEKISFNFGASGILAGQVQQGAPVDLFISADRANVERLVAAKAAERVQVVAGNVLVLVESKNSLVGMKQISDVTKARRLALGEPRVVPAGAYAREALEALKLWDELEKAGKLVTCENVAQVLTLVNRGEVEAGFVYRTDVVPGSQVRIVAEVEASLHGKIEYVSAVVSASKNKTGAEKAQAALGREKVKALLKEQGFSLP